MDSSGDISYFSVKMDYVIHIIGDEIIVELYQMFGT
jgi:hypothetical protein